MVHPDAGGYLPKLGSGGELRGLGWGFSKAKKER
jgi:hypothetical protein